MRGNWTDKDLDSLGEFYDHAGIKKWPKVSVGDELILGHH